jgi:hypothetical protein
MKYNQDPSEHHTQGQFRVLRLQEHPVTSVSYFAWWAEAETAFLTKDRAMEIVQET